MNIPALLRPFIRPRFPRPKLAQSHSFSFGTGTSSSSSAPFKLLPPRSHVSCPSNKRSARHFSKTEMDFLVNENICFPRLRVVDDQGFLGDFDLADALQAAKDRETDLVLIDPQVVPPLA